MSTLKEIATLSGYSISTVSVVLGGKALQRGIPESTQKKIWDAAASLNYKPNIAARALRDHNNQGLFLIALFWASDFRAPMIIRFLRGLKMDAIHSERRDIKFVINFYDNNRLCEEDGLKSLSYYHAAIICNPSQKDMDFLEATNLPLPIVLYNRRSKKYNSIVIDDTQFGHIAAQVFSSHGKHIAQIITSTPAFAGMQIRRTAFAEEARRLGLQMLEPLICENSMGGGYSAACNLSEQSILPDCLYCRSDAIALGVLRAFHDKGIRVPEQIEIIAVGNGDKEQEMYAIPSLSVVALPMEDMASRCLARLLEIQVDPFTPPVQEYLKLRYVARESCGLPNEKSTEK